MRAELTMLAGLKFALSFHGQGRRWLNDFLRPGQQLSGREAINRHVVDAGLENMHFYLLNFKQIAKQTVSAQGVELRLRIFYGRDRNADAVFIVNDRDFLSPIKMQSAVPNPPGTQAEKSTRCSSRTEASSDFLSS